MTLDNLDFNDFRCKVQKTRTSNVFKESSNENDMSLSLSLSLSVFLTYNKAISFYSQAIETKVYKRRWLILMIFVLYSASNAMQWIQYSIIANIIMAYYNVSSFLVDMTSMIYMITYIPFIFPASYLLDRFVSSMILILT